MTYNIKPILNNEGYYASECGNILSSKYGRLKKLKKKVQNNGYESVSLSNKNVKKTKLVHRLVVEAFFGLSNLVVNHKDGVNTNNAIDNLEFCTTSENVKHAYKTGLAKKTRESVRSFSKLDDNKVSEIKKMLKHKTNSELGRIYGVSRQTINSIRIGASWRHVNG